MQALVEASRTRLAVLVYVSDHPGSTVTEVAEALGVSCGLARNHLQRLVEAGGAFCDPPHPVRGQRARYTLNLNRITHELQTFQERLRHPARA